MKGNMSLNTATTHFTTKPSIHVCVPIPFLIQIGANARKAIFLCYSVN